MKKIQWDTKLANLSIITQKLPLEFTTSIFQRTTFFSIIHSFVHCAIFVYPLLKSFNQKNRICKQLSLKFPVRTFLILEGVQRFFRELLSNHKEERKSAEILSSSTIVITQLFPWYCYCEILLRYTAFSPSDHYEACFISIIWNRPILQLAVQSLTRAFCSWPSCRGSVD